MVKQRMVIVIFVVGFAFLAYLYTMGKLSSVGIESFTKLPGVSHPTPDGKLEEGFIAPYYLNDEKLWCDIYPRANGSIYQFDGDLLTGFPFYDRAY
jgi:hypothetical protein